MEQQDGSADLFANFSGVMVLVVAVLMTAIDVRESLIDIQHNDARAAQHGVSTDKQQVGLLEIPYRDNELLFYWKASETSKKQMFTHYAELSHAIRATRPDGIRLRLDGRVPSEIYQKLLADAYDLDISIYQSNRE